LYESTLQIEKKKLYNNVKKSQTNRENKIKNRECQKENGGKRETAAALGSQWKEAILSIDHPFSFLELFTLLISNEKRHTHKQKDTHKF
jgi:hypothetical protein